jgi:hypothetical protein
MFRKVSRIASREWGHRKLKLLPIIWHRRSNSIDLAAAILILILINIIIAYLPNVGIIM